MLEQAATLNVAEASAAAKTGSRFFDQDQNLSAFMTAELPSLTSLSTATSCSFPQDFRHRFTNAEYSHFSRLEFICDSEPNCSLKEHEGNIVRSTDLDQRAHRLTTMTKNVHSSHAECMCRDDARMYLLSPLTYDVFHFTVTYCHVSS